MLRESRDESYLLDILLMAKDASKFTTGMKFHEFIADPKTQYAVIRCFEVMGEAAKRVSESTKTSHPGIPWTEISRMRDLLIHAYARVDLEYIWETLQNDIPSLIAALEKIVPPEQESLNPHSADEGTPAKKF
jgi:uncharacterized protein with HEPN domain